MGEATGIGTLTARQGRQPMNILLWIGSRWIPGWRYTRASESLQSARRVVPLAGPTSFFIRHPRRWPMVSIQDLFDDAKCDQTVRDMRWPDGVTCPRCSSDSVIKDGWDDTEQNR